MPNGDARQRMSLSVRPALGRDGQSFDRPKLRGVDAAAGKICYSRARDNIKRARATWDAQSDDGCRRRRGVDANKRKI
jgi:hypothetical protein